MLRFFQVDRFHRQGELDEINAKCQKFDQEKAEALPANLPKRGLFEQGTYNFCT